jgi:excisionase family DNA binding protein
MEAKSTQGYMRRSAAAVYLSVSPRTISAWQRRRILPFIRIGKKCTLFRRADLDRAVGRFEVKAVGMKGGAA